MATNNILDLPRDQFLASLNELAAQGVNTDELMRQYRRANSPFSGFFDWAINSERDIANEGRTTAGAGLFSKEAGTTGMDALASTRIEPANFIAGLLSGGAQAVDAAGAAAQGLLPSADMPMEALGTAGMAMTGGAAAPRPAGSVGMGGRVTSNSNVQKSVRGMIGDQMDLTMDLVSPEGQRLGRVDYSVYDGQPAIQMIEVAPEFRRQGVATELLRNLQREYPDQEIDWGSLTSEGSQLYNNTRFVDVDQTGGAAQSLPALEAKVRSAEADYLATFRDDFKGDPSPIRELFYNLEDELNAARETAALPPKRLIELSANRDATTGAIALPAARNEAERMARQILEMRAAGRAGEVTDAMMAQADPQYMFNNTPLPMDEASRMARAGEMGFDANAEKYHGTAPSIYSDEQFSPDFTSFNPSRKGQLGAGIYVSPDVRLPNKFARAGDVNRSDFDPNTAIPRGGSIIPAYTRNPNPASLSEMRNVQYGLDNVSGYIDLSRRGTEGLIDKGFTGVVDGMEENVFNPNDIRSRFARFDPEFSHLANLNAANASPLAGILAMPNEEERNRQLGMLFGGYR